MRVLYGKCFGIGNSVMSVPAVRAIRSLGHDVDVLVGSTLDDVGAREVFRPLVSEIGIKVHSDTALDTRYDIAVMAIPFDGRWKNGVHFHADRVVDCRPRPDPTTFGFSSWKKHEVEYQMENAYELGYVGPIPDTKFMPSPFYRDSDAVFLGLGYKKNASGMWGVKHWGTENYVRLVDMIHADDPNVRVQATGDAVDLRMSGAPIKRSVKHPSRFEFDSGTTLSHAYAVVNSCSTYVGNDTGMMHVAASAGLGVVGLFFMEGASTKNPPWCQRKRVLESPDHSLSPEQVFQAYKELRDEGEGGREPRGAVRQDDHPPAED